MERVLKCFCSLAAQCANGEDGYPGNDAQKFEHPDDEDEDRTVEQCMAWVKDNVPHATALYHDQQGSCIAYVSYDGLNDIGNVGSSFCEFSASTMSGKFINQYDLKRPLFSIENVPKFSLLSI